MNLTYKYRLMTFKYQMSLHSCEMRVIHVIIYYYIKISSTDSPLVYHISQNVIKYQDHDDLKLF